MQGRAEYCNAEGQPPLAAVLEELLSWIGDTVDQMDEWQGVKHYPLLVAHDGFPFDYIYIYIC